MRVSACCWLKAGSELRGAIGEQARTLGNKASEQYRRAPATLPGIVAEKGREFVNQAHAKLCPAAPKKRVTTPAARRAAAPARRAARGAARRALAAVYGSRGTSGSGGNFGQS